MNRTAHLLGSTLPPSKPIMNGSAKYAKQVSVYWPDVLGKEGAEGIEVGEEHAFHPESMVLVLTHQFATVQMPQLSACSADTPFILSAAAQVLVCSQIKDTME